MDQDTRERLIRVETKLDMLLDNVALSAATSLSESKDIAKRLALLEQWKTRVVTLYGAAIIVLTTTGGAITAWLLRHS